MATEQVLGYVLGPFGTLCLALLIIISGYKRFWVFGWYAKELYEQNLRLEQKVDILLGEAREIARVAERIVDHDAGE